MRIASWNVNGIRAVERKGLLPWTVLPEMDVLCIQETKAHRDQVPPAVAQPAGYHAAWHSAERKGYSSVALFSKQQPDEVQVGLGLAEFDGEGRVLTARYGQLAVVCAYFPNSQEGGQRIAYKIDFCTAMERHLASWRAKGCGVLLCGDYNIAHQPLDLARPQENEGNPGYLPEERAWFSRFLELGYRDVYREENPEKSGAYSWWSYRARARENNVGWRIDYCCTSPELRSQAMSAHIHPDIEGSDHCPVSITLR